MNVGRPSRRPRRCRGGDGGCSRGCSRGSISLHLGSRHRPTLAIDSTSRPRRRRRCIDLYRHLLRRPRWHEIGASTASLAVSVAAGVAATEIASRSQVRRPVTSDLPSHLDARGVVVQPRTRKTITRRSAARGGDAREVVSAANTWWQLPTQQRRAGLLTGRVEERRAERLDDAVGIMRAVGDIRLDWHVARRRDGRCCSGDRLSRRLACGRRVRRRASCHRAMNRRPRG